MSNIVKWAGSHPVPLALGVFVVGAIVLILMRKPVQVVDNGMGAFYAAQAAGVNSGNALAIAQANATAATAIAGIAANRDVTINSDKLHTAADLADIAGRYSVQTNTITAQRDLDLAASNERIAMAQEEIRRQAQNKAYWQGVGQNALQGQSLPYLLQIIAQGGTGAQAARDVMLAQIQASSQYYAAR